MTVKTNYGTYENCYLVMDHYIADSSLSVEIWNNTDGPIARITKYLGNSKVCENEAYVDTNNCPWAEDFIKEYHLGVPTGLFECSGYCAYPLYKFNLDELEKYAK